MGSGIERPEPRPSLKSIDPLTLLVLALEVWVMISICPGEPIFSPISLSVLVMPACHYHHVSSAHLVCGGRVSPNASMLSYVWLRWFECSCMCVCMCPARLRALEPHMSQPHLLSHVSFLLQLFCTTAPATYKNVTTKFQSQSHLDDHWTAFISKCCCQARNA